MKEQFWMKIAWLLPRPLVMWCAVRLMAHATQGQWGNESPSSLLAMTALQRWPE